MLIVGDTEAAAGTVSIRDRAGVKRDAVPVQELVDELLSVNRTRTG
jgi:threonyl-tRNA synthetase